jgi:hypothetical protein
LQADRFRIFLASPSGLDDYRRSARDQFEHIRMNVASRRGIDFDAIGWEDLPPGFGRPQSVINPKLDECNVLIGILREWLKRAESRPIRPNPIAFDATKGP